MSNQPSNQDASINIVRAKLEHLDVLAPLFDGYRQFYEQTADVEGARIFLESRITAQESTIFLALGVNGEGLGFTQLYPVFTSVGMRRAWLLNDLFVAPEARKQGVAEALMEEARTFAKQTNAAYLTLETAQTNASAQALYEKLGWKRDTEHYFYSLSL
ncbi:MAG: GNAT family N-acetyltransferase [Candidatus Kapaibacterium sp.]|nr:MAG: GNAT family N-acetyltransferase [Candidatus Kapabacteria bacterium]